MHTSSIFYVSSKEFFDFQDMKCKSKPAAYTYLHFKSEGSLECSTSLNWLDSLHLRYRRQLTLLNFQRVVTLKISRM